MRRDAPIICEGRTRKGVACRYEACSYWDGRYLCVLHTPGRGKDIWLGRPEAQQGSTQAATAARQERAVARR